ncbi:UDP-N-acetylmuramate--alanine ligase [Capnocytophaga granulosa]|uniref:UDP-N-acetylmuramate--alanine ligase n=1 Tax=Capnocytophaga granulosa TaxID=45242 RepID=UPI0023EFD105|nr:UDP-N-acetylmuramate--alanine ligase [Capnocytophaga granulosa]
MKIHFITQGEPFLQALIEGLSPLHEVSESVSGAMPTSDTEAVVIAQGISTSDPQWQKAQELQLPIYSYGAFLYQLHKLKTRVVVTGTQGREEIAAMVLHTMEYFSKEIDYFLETPIGDTPSCKYSSEAEFVLIEGNDTPTQIEQVPIFQLYRPTLALISHIEEDKQQMYADFINTLTKGGILLYNDEDTALKAVVENTENQLRLMPYGTAPHQQSGGTTYLITPEGEMPLMISGKEHMNYLSGAKWLCQNLGIDEQDFYEAIETFR